MKTRKLGDGLEVSAIGLGCMGMGQVYGTALDKAANDTVGILRTEAGRAPNDPDLHDLVGELSTRSEEFRTRWARHDVHQHRGGAKQINHPVVGRLDLMYDMLPIAQAPGLSMLVYTAAPGTPSADALQVLASWAATAVAMA